MGTGAVLLAFTTNYYMALTIRIVSGLFNNMTAMLKCMIAEMAGESQAKAMAYFSVAWTTGTLLGPALAGILAMPCEQYGDSFPMCGSKNALIQRFPFILSFLGIGIFTICSGIYAALVVPETLLVKKPLKVGGKLGRLLTFTGTAGIGRAGGKGGRSEVEYSQLHDDFDALEMAPMGRGKGQEDSPLSNASSCSNLEMTGRTLQGVHYEMDYDLEDRTRGEGALAEAPAGRGAASAAIAAVEAAEPEDEELQRLQRKERQLVMDAAAAPTMEPDPAEDPTKGWFYNRDIQVAVWLYVSIALFYVALEELFPLFGSSSIDHGGLSLASKDVGIFMSIGGGFTLPYTIFVFPKLIERKGCIWLLKRGAMTSMLLSVATPFMGLLATKHADDPVAMEGVSHKLDQSGLKEMSALLWVVMIVHTIALHVTATNCFGCTVMLVNKSAPPEFFGTVNSYGQTLASLSRVVGPATVGYLWTLCGRIPDVLAQVSIPFIFCGVTAAAMIVLAHMAPPGLDSFS